MRRQRCPEQEALLELASPAGTMGFARRWRLRSHLSACAPCRRTISEMEVTFQSYFQPDPNVGSSLLKVYGRLKQDETLILKGWKLDEARTKRSISQHAAHLLFRKGWLFRSGLAVAGMAVAWGFLSAPRLSQQEPIASQPPESGTSPSWAQIRIEDGNSVRVHYVHPELLNSTEFESTGGHFQTASGR